MHIQSAYEYVPYIRTTNSEIGKQADEIDIDLYETNLYTDIYLIIGGSNIWKIQFKKLKLQCRDKI